MSSTVSPIYHMVRILADDKSKWVSWKSRALRHRFSRTSSHLWCWHDFSFPHGFSHFRMVLELHITVRDSRPHKHDRLVIVSQVGQGPGWQSLTEKADQTLFWHEEECSYSEQWCWQSLDFLFSRLPHRSPHEWGISPGWKAGFFRLLQKQV